jgi:general secretion pathway protein E
MGEPKLDGINRKLTIQEVLLALVQKGWLDNAESEKILDKRKNSKIHPLIVLSQLRLKMKRPPYLEIGIESLSTWMAEYAELPYLEIDPLKIDIQACTDILPQAFVKRLNVLPVEIKNNILTVATCEPFDRNWVMEVESATNKTVEIVVTSPLQIKHFIDEFFTVHKAAKSFSNSLPKGRERNNPDLEKMLGEGSKKGLV